jgi:hypothetical protein
MSRFNRLNFEGIKTYSIKERYSKVNIEDFASPIKKTDSLEAFLKSLPNILIGSEFREFIENFRKAIVEKNTIIIMLGAHVIKCGLNPLIIKMLKNGYVSHLALNGAGVIHDVEIANWGVTSEDVSTGLQDGSFGMAKETASFINDSIKENKNNSKGYAEVVGEKIIEKKTTNINLSLLATCIQNNIPLSIHPAYGTEIIHQHPNVDGAAFGQKSLIDFEIFTHSISKLKKGSIVLNIGSAVILPEIFLKALTVVRNLGYPAFGFYTAVFDMIKHYRPSENVQNRPTISEGKGYYFIGHHEIMLPLLVGLLNK